MILLAKTSIMKIIKVLFLLLGICVINSCIVVAPTRMDDDGSGQIAPIDSSIIVEKENFRIEQINYNKLLALVDKQDTSWVVLWAPWCAHCIAHILDDAYIEKARKLGIDKENLIFISTNYDLEHIEKYLRSNNYGKVTYVLNSKDYGNKENGKINLFNLEVTNDSANSIPRNYFFSKGKLIFSNGGGLDFSIK